MLARKRKTLTESGATRIVNWLFYYGCGNRYLGWRLFEYEVLDDDSEILMVPGGPRTWPTPTGDRRKWWNPTWEHLKGLPRGICRGREEKNVPFVSVDLDRHDGNIPCKAHILSVLRTGRILKKFFGGLRWLVETNPENGSTKFFGFSGKPIPVDRASKISEAVHGTLIEAGLGSREVFPHNSPQVFLPMREGKATIIDLGTLPTCTRRQKIGGYFEDSTTYSALAFLRWLRHGGNYDEATLVKTLVEACRNLPDRNAVAQEVQPPRPLHETAIPPMPSLSPSPQALARVVVASADQQEPDSFIRQRTALLTFCRRKRRVISVEEALDHIRRNKLYTGDWATNLAARRARVLHILTYISKTFDPALCEGIANDIEIGKHDVLARKHCPCGWRAASRHNVDEYGSVRSWRDRNVADWRFVSVFLSITEYLLLHDKNEDHTVPLRRAEAFGDCWRPGESSTSHSAQGNGP